MSPHNSMRLDLDEWSTPRHLIEQYPGSTHSPHGGRTSPALVKAIDPPPPIPKNVHSACGEESPRDGTGLPHGTITISTRILYAFVDGYGDFLGVHDPEQSPPPLSPVLWFQMPEGHDQTCRRWLCGSISEPMPRSLVLELKYYTFVTTWETLDDSAFDAQRATA